MSLIFPFASEAQRVDIRGVVRDVVDNEPLPRVSVRLMHAKDSAYVAGTTGNNEGVFRIKEVPHGSYIVQFSFLGYSTQYVNINTRSVRSQCNMGEILMTT
ncbi:MAG: carboxypeptidase regulatory-like domain-containing protein, partial [Bacteroidales bacterium]|nr:carboxypeptidase regulatory-like domain-containing protein [Bacteroidales bacterium]